MLKLVVEEKYENLDTEEIKASHSVTIKSQDLQDSIKERDL